MHENREISSAPSAVSEGRSGKAHSRTTDMHVLEKSDWAVVPVNRPNKGRKLPAEVGEGRVQLKEYPYFPLLLSAFVSHQHPWFQWVTIKSTSVRLGAGYLPN